MSITVHHVGMILPNMICVIARDSAVGRGTVQYLDMPVSGAYETWALHDDLVRGGQDYAWVLGSQKRILRFQDRAPDAYVNRVAAKVAVDWGVTGKTVSAVFYENRPWEHGFWSRISAGSSKQLAAFEHWFFVKLDSALTSGGTVTITPPAGSGIPSCQFSFSDNNTRSPAIHGTFVGHRPGDGHKLAYLSFKVFGYGTEGYIDYINDVGLSTFDVIDESGATVFTGNITQRATPTTTETFAQLPTTLDPGGTRKLRQYASSTQDSIAVLGHIAGNPGKLAVASGHGLVENEQIILGQLAGLGVPGGIIGSLVRVTNISGDQFEMYYWSGSAWTAVNTTGRTYVNGSTNGNAADVVFKTYEANAGAAYVFGLDYSSFTPAVAGTYRIRVPGIGVSDPFEITEHAWHNVIRIMAKGEYNQRHQKAYSSSIGGFEQTDIFQTQPVYKSLMPSLIAEQGGYINGSGITPVNVSFGMRSSWGPKESPVEVTGGDPSCEWNDAADWDVFPNGHLFAATPYTTAWDCLPESARNAVTLSTPLTSSVFGSAYAELDDAPSLLHQIIYPVLWLKERQEVDGAVPSGLQGTAQGNMAHDPMNDRMAQWYTYMPDHPNNFAYAAQASTVGRIIRDAGYSIGQDIIDSAELAFVWAEDIWDHIVADIVVMTGGSGTFVHGETITCNSQTAICWLGGTTTIQVRNRTGAWTSGSVVGSTSGASRTFSTITPNALFDPDYYYPAASPVLKRTVTFSGTTTSGSFTITGISDTSALLLGDHITGTGIPSDSLISVITASTVTFVPASQEVAFNGNIAAVINLPATASGTVTITARAYGGGLSDLNWYKALSFTYNEIRRWRLWSVGALKRATEKPAYDAEYIASHFLGSGTEALGGWEYINSVNPNSSINSSVRSNLLAGSNSRVTNTLGSPYCIGNAGVFNAATFGGSIAASFHIMSHYIDPVPANKPNRLKAMQACMASIMGANQQGVSTITGIGPRDPVGILHDNSFILGRTALGDEQALKAPSGIGAYSWSWFPRGFITAGVNCWSNSFLSHLNDVWTTAGEATDDDHRVVEPTPDQRPSWYWNQSRWIIGDNEYGVPNITVPASYAIYLHAWDGNTDTELTDNAPAINNAPDPFSAESLAEFRDNHDRLKEAEQRRSKNKREHQGKLRDAVERVYDNIAGIAPAIAAKVAAVVPAKAKITETATSEEAETPAIDWSKVTAAQIAKVIATMDAYAAQLEAEQRQQSVARADAARQRDEDDIETLLMSFP